VGEGALLSVRGLGKVYPDGSRALHGVDLDVMRGEFVVIIGLSGAGKSTFLRCLNRLLEPTGGAITFGGEDVTHVEGARLRALRRRLAMIFQQFNLIGRASVLVNVMTGSLERQPLWRSLLGLWDRGTREEARRTLALVGLDGYDRRRADRLSGGQQQRVAIARALMQHPQVILADEPVASLDPATSHSVMRYLKALQTDHGLTVLANLHFLSLARQYATRVVALKAGEKVFDGPPAEITDERFRAIYGEDAVEVEVR
jgi:phosphonate transport system ATP-binding protein